MFFLMNTIQSQEMITEFNTSHVSGLGNMSKMQMNFKVYNDSLVMSYLGKNIVKMMEKRGIPTKVTYTHPFELTATDIMEMYVFRSDEEDFQIVTKNKAGLPSVRIRKKDTFSNEVVEMVYISVK